MNESRFFGALIEPKKDALKNKLEGRLQKKDYKIKLLELDAFASDS